MFRLLKLHPPHGWNAVAWELGIVTLGVLIALAAQQWADDLGWRARARAATEGVRDEVADHYRFSAEWRRVEPCLYAQIDRLAARLTAADGERIEPAPVYTEPSFAFYVLRMPSRTYNRGAWDAAISDGATTHMDRRMRNALNTVYTRIDQLNAANTQNNDAYPQLFGLSRSLPMDAASRLGFLRILDQLRGRVEYMALRSGQIIGGIEKAGLAPDKAEVARLVSYGGTVKFCQRNGYPLRPMAEAMQALPE